MAQHYRRRNDLHSRSTAYRGRPLVVGRNAHRAPSTPNPSFKRSGYVARITGKLLHDCATGGQHLLFLADPKSESRYVYAGTDSSGAKVFEVPREFYKAVFNRLVSICGDDSGAVNGRRVLSYSGTSYELLLTVVESPNPGIVLAFTQVDQATVDA
jgi:hypothetical protein